MKGTRLMSWLLIVLMTIALIPATGLAEAPTANPTLPEDWVPFEETVHITVPVYDRSKEGYPAVDDNYWTKWVQSEFGDKWNVEVEYVAIPRGDVMTKYSLLIAGGDTPTILMEYDYPKVAQWATDGAMKAIDLEAFAAVAPTYYQRMVENNQLGYTKMNGEDFFVLSERPYYDTPFAYSNFIRMDWLEQVGITEVPKNYEEQKAAIAAIKEAGLSEYPMPLSVPAAAYIGNFGFRDFPVDEAEWAMHSSLGTPGFAWEPTQRMLRRTNEEYNAGWYSPEFDLAVETGGAVSGQQESDFINGKTFQYGGYISANMDWLIAFYEKNPDAKLAIASEYSGEEEGVCDAQLRADNPFGMIVGFSSLATEDQLKAAWMLMEWMLQDEVLFVMENGVEGVTYTLGEDGLPIVDGEYRGEEMLNHNNNIDMTCLVHASKKIGTIEQTLAQMAPQGLPQDFYDMLVAKYYEQMEIAEEGKSYSDPIFAVAIESESEYSAALLSLYQEYYAKLVKCAPEEFDALYEEYSQAFLDAGYQEIMDERLAAYEDGMTTKLPVSE